MGLLAGIALVLLAGYLSALDGRFGFFLWDLDRPIHCSQAYLDPRLRLLLFRLPVLVLTLISLLLLPDWVLGLLAIAVVLAARQCGRVYGRRLAVRETVDYLIADRSLDRNAALAEAKKMIASVIKMNGTLRG